MPSPFEIEYRGYMTRLLKRQGFTRHEVGSIMQHEMPEPARVQQLVARYGVAETQRRIRPFLVENEYTREEQDGLYCHDN